MTNQRRRNLRDVLTAEDTGEARRARLMETTFWRPARTASPAQIVDLAAVRRSLA